MKKVSWNGLPAEDAPQYIPTDLASSLFDHLPPPINFTRQMDELATKYLGNQINAHEYLAMQAAAFLRPKTVNEHESRRNRFSELSEQATNLGFTIPTTFRRLIESDEFMDRLHHNTIWIQLPEELWRLPADETKLMFLAFVEGQGCCAWHLMLANDGTHKIACCEHAFGLVSVWPRGVPDYSEWNVDICGESVEEWLYHFFVESREHDLSYLEQLGPYKPTNGG